MSFQNDRITAIPAPEPLDYDRQYSFTDWEALHPTSPKPAAGLEAEFNAIQQALDETQARARLIQRSDGALANASVGVDQLKPDVQIGVNPPTAWAAFTGYTVRDSVVFNNEAWYVCLVAHTSGADFAADLAAEKWQLIFDFDDLLTTEVQALADAAEASALAAAASVASVNLPSLTASDAGKLIVVNPTYNGYDLDVKIDASFAGNTVPLRDASGRIKAGSPVATSDVATKAYVDVTFSTGSVTTAKLADEAVTTAKLADEAVTTAKLADEAVTAAKINPALWLTSGGTYGVSVVTTPSAANEYATIQAAFAAVLSASIPAGGYVEIDVVKTTLTDDDKVSVPEGADYSWIRLRFRGSTYSVPGGSGDAFIAVGMAARGPRIWLTGSATFSVGAGTNGISVLEDGELFISGSSTSHTLTINSANGPVTIRGGRVYVRDIDLALTGNFAALRIRQGGEVVTDSDTATISATCSTVNEAAIVLETGSRLRCKGATATSGHTNAVAVSSGSDAILQDLTATSTGTRVQATAAGVINLNGSAATCNLTNNTVSTNGILIR